MDFYDQDPSALELSLPPRNQAPLFYFLGDAKKRGANVRFVVGPVRQALTEKAPRRFYHVLLIDTIRHEVSKPATELLTKEAFASYLEILADDGVICIHTSNRDFDLVPVVSDLAQHLGLACTVLRDHADSRRSGPSGRDATHYSSEWVIVTRKTEYLAHTQPPPKSDDWDIEWRTPEATGKHVWTDAGPNSLEPLRRWRFVPLPLRDKKDGGK